MKHFTSFQLQFAFALLLLFPLAVSAQNNSNGNLKPNPYPVLKSTGNPVSDKLAHEQAVKDWNEKELKRNQILKQVQNAPLSADVKNDPAHSKNLDRKESMSNKNDIELSEVSTIRQNTIIDLPGFPKYVSTGNFELDEKNYSANKAQWIKANPEEYQNYLKELRKKNPSTLKRIDHSNSSK